MAHLALAVHDEERSRRFYERYFGFDAEPAERMDDGVLMLYDGKGFALDLKETEEPILLPEFLHFAFRGAQSPDEVREFRAQLERDGVPVTESWEEPGYVSVKCRDPDGYVIELAWEPEPGLSAGSRDLP
jgi:catechol 2,3-dioxygenase-like lactoylglutathione lyase family enzyme